MKLLFRRLLFFLLAASLISCSFSSAPDEVDYSLLPQPTTEKELFRKGLYGFYSSWEGTPYKEGGMSKKGIDCSGLVYLAFRDLKHITLPRTTEELQKVGFEVELFMLQPGDLLFFDTGMFSDHVGIYIDRDRFLHVSSSQGVILSRLSNSYWSDTFEMAKRIDTSRE